MNPENIIQELKKLIEKHETQDPYAELKKAHADGKVIQVGPILDGEWEDIEAPKWNSGAEHYRIKPEEPWTLGRELPGFRSLRDGEEWHRMDFTREMLEGGWRPLLLGESDTRAESVKSDGSISKTIGSWGRARPHWNHLRTKRHLPILTALQVAEGWKEHHGEENPAPGKRIIVCLRSEGSPETAEKNPEILRSEEYQWRQHNENYDIIAYRIIEPRIVPLGPEDVRCGDEVRMNDTRYSISSVDNEGVNISTFGYRTFTQLQEEWKIRRRDSATFEPCSKEGAQ